MTTEMTEEGRELLAIMREQRGGRTMAMHEILAARDPAFLLGYHHIFNAAQSDAQGLPAWVRELLVMALDLAVGVNPNVVRAHARKAVSLGATEAQVLGAIELAALVMAGRALSFLPSIFEPEQSPA
ncbi:carboxymuconolactone decarboxylase family protein [Dactylosporangium sp. CA-092794]|uniref:carboxymuconolactone decarboxylase family protein n=1 Tax=Dactylosporangium sp. CA-092794 TaxID=3239929 RepID=UPI003D8B9FC5